MASNVSNTGPEAVALPFNKSALAFPKNWALTLSAWILVGLITYISFNLTSNRKSKSLLPTVGLRPEFFSHIRVTIRNIRGAEGLKNLLNEGYHKVNI